MRAHARAQHRCKTRENAEESGMLAVVAFLCFYLTVVKEASILRMHPNLVQMRVGQDEMAVFTELKPGGYPPFYSPSFPIPLLSLAKCVFICIVFWKSCVASSLSIAL